MFRGDDEDDEGISIWIFIAAFVVIATIGLVIVVITGSPTTDSRSTRTAFPSDTSVSGADGAGSGGGATTSVDETDSGAAGDDQADGGVTGNSGATKGGGTGSGSASGVGGSVASSTPAPPATLPDGSSAPAGVTRVVSTGDVLSFGFEVDPKGLGDRPLAVVPPMSADPSDGGKSLVVTVRCAKTSREQLAQVSVTETPAQVTVSGVTLVPANALGCSPSAEPRVIAMPLSSALGSRSVAIIPTSTKLPSVDLSQPGTN